MGAVINSNKLDTVSYFVGILLCLLAPVVFLNKRSSSPSRALQSQCAEGKYLTTAYGCTHCAGELLWTMSMDDQAIAATSKGVAVTQANGYKTWAFTINSAALTAVQDAVVTQEYNNVFATGTLTTAVTGTSVTTIKVTSALNQTFVSTAHLQLASASLTFPIASSQATNATSTTITHVASTRDLVVGDVVTVTGHTGNAANTAMNQAFTVASVTSSTIAVLTGTGMIPGTYNTGTISGATGNFTQIYKDDIYTVVTTTAMFLRWE